MRFHSSLLKKKNKQKSFEKLYDSRNLNLMAACAHRSERNKFYSFFPDIVDFNDNFFYYGYIFSSSYICQAVDAKT